ncbi:sensor histidine kinase [Polaromonas naphthalenivorans]|uniref:sensor histidine kinase n=1 Tax=Polaromonas naphthalenivorans TaxID=216465 RepID=UPI000067DCDF|nr:ATP-binding protein [Polaromonas naphthalenivorans]
MDQIIDSLMALARVSRSEVAPVAVNLSALARQAERECREREAARQVQVSVEDGLMAQGDAGLLRIVLQNLVGNAWKYSAKRQLALIEVGSQTEAGGQTVYFVKDNGAGFDMAYAHKLFAPFERLHPASEFAGTGIGLATAQKIISRHGGRIWAGSMPGQGAAFYFTLGAKAPHGLTA